MARDRAQARAVRPRKEAPHGLAFYPLHFLHMRRSPLSELLPPWSSRIRPYPPGKPIEEVERELGHPAIKLASNENPLGPSPRALEAIRNYLDRVHLYPDGNGYYLRKALSEYHELEMNQVILGAGSTDLIELVAKTFLTAGDEGITSQSSFYIYRTAIEEMGAGLTATPMRDFVLVLRTFSKVHGLAGLRIGYGMGHAELIESLNRIRSPFNANSLAQAAAVAALDDREHVARSIESNLKEMKFVTEELTLLGVRYTPSVANFLLIDTGRDCQEDFVRLLHEGVIVRPMRLYSFPTSVRVTVGTHRDNEQFLEALRRVVTAPIRAARI